VASLNVSVAAGLLLYEVSRRLDGTQMKSEDCY